MAKLPVNKDHIEKSKIHEAINNICKNKYIEKTKPELLNKVRELKTHWKERLKEAEQLADKENQEAEDNLYFGKLATY